MTELERTLQMRLNHVIYAFRQLAMEQRRNSTNVGQYTKRRLEYCAEEIEQTLKLLASELPQIRWLEVD